VSEELTIKRNPNGYVGLFSAMASPCLVLVDAPTANMEEEAKIHFAIQQVQKEAKRIEQKFSRYLDDNVMAAINHSDGQEIELDEETSRLLDFAYQCYELSDGLFDVTSGVLRRAWRFDGSDNVPLNSLIEILLPLIGLNKLQWQKPKLKIPNKMELDFGGIGKEYAVDRCLQVASQHCNFPILVNFGGDLACTGPRLNDQAWQVGIESVGGGKPALLSLKKGAMATSGDARRFLLKDGIRYSHILNPKTGQSIVDAPSSVTVTAPTCIQAGLMSTLALLQGSDAEAFLQAQEIQYWIQQ
jgi:thiamine biosynthesis lipoprotein